MDDILLITVFKNTDIIRINTTDRRSGGKHILQPHIISCMQNKQKYQISFLKIRLI